jgi:hypothetical protein
MVIICYTSSPRAKHSRLALVTRLICKQANEVYMKKRFLNTNWLLVLTCLLFVHALHASTPPDPACYNVVWDSPGKDARDSMPLGNGDIGLNAWVETNGDISFYIGKTDSWDDNGRLLKVGKVRVTLNPAPVMSPFHQELALEDAAIRVSYGDGTALRLWVDANHPVIHMESVGKKLVAATAAIELWRTAPYELPSIECSDVMMDRAKPNNMHDPTIVEPDTLLKEQSNRIGWFHHNIKSVGPAIEAETQGMTGYPRQDPLLHRTFGAVITAPDATRLDDTHLKSNSGNFSIHVLTRHPSSPEQWLADMDALIAKNRKHDFKAHRKWWAEFWNRSWICASSATTAGGVQTNHDDAAYVSQMYALQRFINAGGGRGHYPIKYNGSIFTVPSPGAPGNADYRRWGPGFWWQNTRLPYFSMPAAGDFDLMEPLFKMYVDELLPLNEYRTQHYFGIENAAYYVECVHFWGDVFNESYGWQPMAERKDPLQVSRYHKWEWVGGLELVSLLLDRYDYAPDKVLLEKRIIPTAMAVMRFFDGYYKTNESGKLVMSPSQACETWWDCTNPMPEIAGLRAITARLLALPESATPADARAFWKNFQAKLPPLPVRDTPTGKALAPAEQFANKRNCENPELYAVFPFRLCSFEKDNRDLGIQALNHRWDSGNKGWRQDDLFMTCLGLTDQAKQAVVSRARSHDPTMRFPAFWGPNYDWTPDQCHGGVFMRTFQTMLMQTEGDKIFLLPAWPKDWDVDFKLHAPGNTVVEGVFRGGKFVRLDVTPKARRKDLVVPRANQ